MPETKYTTQIYLALRGVEEPATGRAAARVYQDFLGRLRRNAPSVKNLRLEVQQPAARKGTDGVFEVWADLKAVVPHDLTALGAEGHRDAWRSILKKTFHTSCQHNQELVYRTSSRVEITREVLPGEELPQEAKAPVEEKPKELIKVRVLLGGQEFNVEVPKAENLLDGVNDKGVAVKWDCKSGVCDTCKVRVLKGMENLSPVNDNERNMLGDQINQGYRLSCQVTANGPVEFEQK
ncbi:MAG TPA: 2Fe-2S iron-sulfur cluster binding domain-containing protein [Symbiobacteriaceae bacterium]|nr:2Fe-2S iron-sulfur cluster binding domain-containing protein [Symbiobacteriaceae bacterium]